MRVILRLFDWIHDRYCPCKYTDWIERAALDAERKATGETLCSCGNLDCQKWRDVQPRYVPTCKECGEQHWTARCRGCGERMCETNPHMRVYCPKCGEVGCGMKRQGQWIARPHYRTAVNARGGRDNRPCTGGPIDPGRDKAP